MTNEELNILLNKLRQSSEEAEWFEFKEAKNDFHFEKLGMYFSALSNEANLKNKEYAWLIFGIDDKRQIVGTSYREKGRSLDSLKSEVAKHTTSQLTFIEIYVLFVDKKRIVLFQIPSAPKGIPIAWKGVWYGRNDEELSPLNIQELEQIRNQKEDWSAKICEEASIDDLDEEAIIKARVEFKKKHPRLANEVDSWNDINFLNKAKITLNGKITNTALLLLGRYESDHYFSPAVAQITWDLRAANNNSKDYEHFGTPLLLSVDKVLHKIRNLKYRYMPKGTLFPNEVEQYDIWVLREALHNCIAHQNYRLNRRICVVEKDDEILFTNAGSFMPGNVEDVIRLDSPPDFYRNKFLVEAMVNLDMIDTLGSGIKKMFLTQRKRFFPLPLYDLSKKDGVIVRITGKIIDENYTQLLINNTNLELETVIILDKVQKKIKITKEELKILKTKGLVEGRYPNLFVASEIAKITGDKTSYIRNMAFDKEHYKKMIVAYIKKYSSASRNEIDELLLNKLPDILDQKQKKIKIMNLLAEMARKDKAIKNIGATKTPKWVLL